MSRSARLGLVTTQIGEFIIIFFYRCVAYLSVICVAGNLDWLCCKTLSCGVASVVQDLSLYVDIIDCPEMQLIRDCFLLLKPTLDFIDGHTGKG